MKFSEKIKNGFHTKSEVERKIYRNANSKTRKRIRADLTKAEPESPATLLSTHPTPNVNKGVDEAEDSNSLMKTNSQAAKLQSVIEIEKILSRQLPVKDTITTEKILFKEVTVQNDDFLLPSTLRPASLARQLPVKATPETISFKQVTDVQNDNILPPFSLRPWDFFSDFGWVSSSSSSSSSMENTNQRSDGVFLGGLHRRNLMEHRKVRNNSEPFKVCIHYIFFIDLILKILLL